MAGSGTKLWATGDTVSASEFQSYVQDQTIAVFDDATARDAAYGGAGEPTASEGMVCFLLDTNCVQVHTGSVWYNTIDIDSFSFEADGDMALSKNLIIGSAGGLSVGSGTTPTEYLDVQNTTGSGAIIKYDGTANTEFGLTIRSNISGGNFESDFANGGVALLNLDANSATTSGGDFLVCQTQSSDPVLLVKGNGKIGVGTASPAAPLQVNTTESDAATLILNTTHASSKRCRLQFAYGGTLGWEWGTDTTSGGITDMYAYNRASGTVVMTMLDNGNVGIGTTAPNNSVAVGIATASPVPNVLKGLDIQYGTETKAGVQMNPSTGEVRMGALNSTGDYFTTLYADGAEKMRITAAGNVGIGRTPSSSFALDVEKGNASTYVRIRITDSYSSYSRAALYIEGGSNEGAIIYLGDAGDVDIGQIQYWNPDNSMRFVTNTAERMRIDSGGQVGIGDAAPAYLLDIDEAVSDAVPLHVEMSSGGTAYQYLARFSRNGGLMTNGVYCDTGTAYFGTPSDERVKRDIATIDPADSLAAITALRPVDFRFIADPDDGEIRNGLIAQEVELVIPAAVHTVIDSEPRRETVSVPRVETVVDDDGNETRVPVLDEDGDPIIDEDTQPVLDENGQKIIDVTGDTKMMEWNALTSHMIGAIKNIDARLTAGGL